MWWIVFSSRHIDVLLGIKVPNSCRFEQGARHLAAENCPLTETYFRCVIYTQSIPLLALADGDHGRHSLAADGARVPANLPPPDVPANVGVLTGFTRAAETLSAGELSAREIGSQ